jgi:hypothetical protein
LDAFIWSPSERMWKLSKDRVPCIVITGKLILCQEKTLSWLLQVWGPWLTKGEFSWRRRERNGTGSQRVGPADYICPCLSNKTPGISVLVCLLLGWYRLWARKGSQGPDTYPF